MEISYEAKTSDQRRSENLARYLRKKQEREALQSKDSPSEPQPLLALPGPSFPDINFDPPEADDSNTCSPPKENGSRGHKFYINGRYRCLMFTVFEKWARSCRVLPQADLSGQNCRNQLFGSHGTNRRERLGLLPHHGQVPRGAQPNLARVRPAQPPRRAPASAFSCMERARPCVDEAELSGRGGPRKSSRRRAVPRRGRAAGGPPRETDGNTTGP